MPYSPFKMSRGFLIPCRYISSSKEVSPSELPRPRNRIHKPHPQNPQLAMGQDLVNLLGWVCLKIGYIPNYRHLMGIMISKTIGFRGLAYFQTHPDGFSVFFGDEDPKNPPVKPRYWGFFGSSRHVWSKQPRSQKIPRYFQWEFQDPKLEVPTIYKAYIRPM